MPPEYPANVLLSGWYLNLEYPSNCSGNVTGMTMYFYEPITPPGNYCVWWAVFDPLEGNNFLQVGIKL